MDKAVRLLVAVLSAVLLAGCLPPIFPGTRAAEPYTLYLEALVAEEPEVLATHVRSVVGGTVIVGEEPVPPGAEFVSLLRPHPAGTRLRFEHRVRKGGFSLNHQMLDLYYEVLEAWSSREDGFVPAHRARLVAQASAPTCYTDTSNTGLPLRAMDDEPTPPVEVEEPPELIGGLGGLQERVAYPDAARRAGVEGTVVAQFLVDEAGEVSCLDIVLGIPFGVNESVLAAVKASAFEPGRQGGEPVEVRVSLPVKFRLP